MKYEKVMEMLDELKAEGMEKEVSNDLLRRKIAKFSGQTDTWRISKTMESLGALGLIKGTGRGVFEIHR